jgi:PAS domain S-box-containing protein
MTAPVVGKPGGGAGTSTHSWIDAVPVPLLVVDRNDRILAANRSVSLLLGGQWPPAEDDSFSACLPPGDRERARRAVTESIDSKRTTARQGPRIAWPSAQGVSDLQLWTSALDDDSALCALTRESEARRTGQDREGYLQLAMEVAQDALLVLRVQVESRRLSIVAFNDGYRRRLEHGGLATTNMGLEVDADSPLWGAGTRGVQIWDELWKVALTKHPALLIERVGERPRERHYETSIAPVVAPSGECQFLVCGSRDMTHAIRASHELVAAQSDFSCILRTSPVASALFDLDHEQLVEVSEAYCEALGQTPKDVLGRPHWELETWESRLCYEHFYQTLRRTGHVRDFEGIRLSKQGRRIECLMSGRSVPLGEQLLAFTSFVDISARKLAEQENALLEQQVREAHKLEALGTLAGGIAHDFNNILASVVARSALIGADALVPELVLKHVAEIAKATDRAKALVQRILAFSRQGPQARVALRLEDAVRDALNLVRPTFPATTSIQLEVVGAVPIILADPTQVHQVIMNLCANASQAMLGQVGTVTIEVVGVQVDPVMAQQVPSLREGRYACLRVRDTGHGMDAETLSRAFDPFFTTKPLGEGTGLGLAVVHGVVRDHGGAILVNSLPGLGTSFQLFLPEHTGVVAVDVPSQTSLRPGAGERVLLVDDEEQICEAIGSLLSRVGYRVTTFCDPTLALQALLEDPSAFDVLLTDLTMPKLSGVDLAQAALRVRGDLPVVVTSGYTAPWTSERLRASGIHEFAPKPLIFSDLSQALRRALDRAKRRAGGEPS